MTEQNWDDAYDVVVVGTGAAGLTAAVTAADQGQSVLVVEKESEWGGTTGYSGGGLWVPGNPFLRRSGGADSPEDALAYLDATVGDSGPATSRVRKRAYLRSSKELIRFLHGLGYVWVHSSRYPDYYPDAPGARRGRAVESGVFDGRKLGPWLKTIVSVDRPPIAVRSDEMTALQTMTRGLRPFLGAARVFARTAAWFARGRYPLAAGLSLVAQLMHILQTRHVPVWLDSPLRDLVVEDGRVVGVVVEREGRVVRIAARQAVLLAAGGFSRGDAFRRRHQPVGADWTATAPGDTGEVIELGAAAGGVLAQMENSWWGPSYRVNGTIMLCLWERSLPGAILVDDTGHRFVNESTSYIDVGAAMIERQRERGEDVPFWLILDADHRRRYLFGAVPGGRTPRALIDDGTFVRGETLGDLARQCGIDADGLRDTVERFNGFAYSGIDADHRRGDDLYDRFFSDASIRPNPNLGPIEHAPFWAVRMYPGDAGTSGGLLTDEHARVLDGDGVPIAGLYASGNTTASVMGHLYPGPGATLGPAMTFAYIAMRHVASESETRDGDTPETVLAQSAGTTPTRTEHR